MTKNYNFFSKSNCGNTICVFNKPNRRKRSTNKKTPSLFNKKKEGINMNKNLVKVLVAGVAVAVVGAVAGAVVITKKVKARKARKAEALDKRRELINKTKEQIKSDREAGVNIRKSVEEEVKDENINEVVEEEKATDEKVSDAKVDESETTKETINEKQNGKSGKEKTKEKANRARRNKKR